MMLYSKYNSFSCLKFEGERVRRPCSREECWSLIPNLPRAPETLQFPKALHALKILDEDDQYMNIMMMMHIMN